VKTQPGLDVYRSAEITELSDSRTFIRGIKPYDSTHPNPYSRVWFMETPLLLNLWNVTNYTSPPNTSQTEVVTTGGGIQVPSIGLFPLPDSTASLNVARANYGKNLSGTRVNWMENLGEYRESMRMFSSRGNSLFHSLYNYGRSRPAKLILRDIESNAKAFMSGSKSALRRIEATNKMAAESYLAWKFGAQPLISDVEDASKVVKRGLRLKRKLRGTSSSTETARYAYFFNAATRCGTQITYRASRQTVYLIGSVFKEYENDQVPVSQQLGLSWQNALPTIWELIPNSFIVDYFTNMQEIIQSVCAQVYSGGQGLYQTTFSRYYIEVVKIRMWDTTYGDTTPYGNGGTKRALWTGGTVSAGSMQRITQGISLIPSLELSIPNPAQFVNMGALLVAKAHQVGGFTKTPLSIGLPQSVSEISGRASKGIPKFSF